MKHVHFLGLAGSGASAIAAIAQAQGYIISGCDKNPHNEFTIEFSDKQLMSGHSATHLEGVDILAVTPAVFSLDPENEELQAAKEKGIEVLTWQEFMGKYLEEEKFVIAICGTHGKSTTTAMIGLLLEEAGLDPTVELGAIVPKWGKNYRLGKSNYFITEADEFNNNYLATTPDIAVVTTIEMDHPEFFKDFEEYKDSFETFLKRTKKTIVANVSDSGVGQVLKWVAKSEHPAPILDYSRSDFQLNLKIPGQHNLLNAQAAFQVGLLLGIDTAKIKKSLEEYTGIGRRFEKLGEVNGAVIYSDFAHHPTEIEMTIKAANEKFKDKKLWVVFQPHMFSRTKELFPEFVKVLRESKANGISIIDIYPSREIDTGIVSSEELVKAINKPTITYDKDKEALLDELHKTLGNDDIVIFMGAGDIDNLARSFVKSL